jgi:hypothetical protein
MSKLSITIGADPELFVRHIKTGEFVSAHTLMPGTKTEPHKVSSGAIQVDGVAAEFNIDPATNAQGFTSNIAAVMGQLQGFVGKDYELVSDPAVVFKSDYFKSLPEHVRELGCNPDFNAWTGQVNEKPDGDSTTMRTAAGHIHIGGWYNGDPTDSTHFEDCRIVAKNLDYYLGLYSLQWDSEAQRRKLYGKAGSFRPKPYGIEYRPLSNVWLRSPKLQAWVYQAALACTQSLLTTGTQLEDVFGDIAQRFIDSSESWWLPEDLKKSSDHRKIAKLSQHTGLTTPPPLPKPVTKEEAKTVVKPEAKFIYGGAKTGKSILAGTQTQTITYADWINQLQPTTTINN